MSMLNNYRRIIDDFVTNHVSLDNDYTHDELRLLMQLDRCGQYGAAIASLSDDDILESFISQNVSDGLKNLPICDSIKLREIIYSEKKSYVESDTHHYVFDVTVLGVNKIMYQHREIFFDDQRKKYYLIKPYYLGDKYVFVNQDKSKSMISTCKFLRHLRIIAPSCPYWEHNIIHTNIYHFRSDEEMINVDKLLESNLKLFTCIHHHRKSDVDLLQKAILGQYV